MISLNLNYAMENQSNKPWGLFGSEYFTEAEQSLFLAACTIRRLDQAQMVLLGESREGRYLGDELSVALSPPARLEQYLAFIDQVLDELEEKEDQNVELS